MFNYLNVEQSATQPIIKSCENMLNFPGLKKKALLDRGRSNLPHELTWQPHGNESISKQVTHSATQLPFYDSTDSQSHHRVGSQHNRGEKE